MVRTRKDPPTSEAILTLERLETARPCVQLPDGVKYELADYEMFGLRQRAEVKKLIARIEGLEKVDEPTEGDDTEYRGKLMELCRLALPGAPVGVLEGLTTAQRGDVAGAFFVPLLDRPGMRMLEKARTSISERSSRPSNGTTAQPVPRTG